MKLYQKRGRFPGALGALVALSLNACGGGNDTAKTDTSALVQPSSPSASSAEASASEATTSAAQASAPASSALTAATAATAPAQRASGSAAARTTRLASGKSTEPAGGDASIPAPAVTAQSGDAVPVEATAGTGSNEATPAASAVESKSKIRIAAAAPVVSTLSRNFPAFQTKSSATAASTPFVERLEQIASDGMNTTTPLPNHWGGHQTRITSHTDGTIRVLYFRQGASQTIDWRLMKRDPKSGVWAQEATGNSYDDVTLLRDPVSDGVHVVAWPKSVPTIYSSPGFAGKTVPGTWENMAPTSRHYGGSGIGPDGTLCIKASVESSGATGTASTSTQYICGRYSAASGAWSWGSQVSKAIDYRRAYDYIYPGGAADAASFMASSQMDLYKDAAGLKALASSSGNYVFNGVSSYSSGTSSASSWNLQNIVTPYAAPANASTAPVVRQFDSFVDSKKRFLVTYYVDDPLKATPKGLYLVVADASGKVLYKGQWTALPTYGYVRIFEDGNARLWLLWTNLGTQLTQVTLYPIKETSTPTLSFSLGSGVDLASKFSPYAIYGSTTLALPRGGQSVGNAVDGLMFACDGTFANAKLASCEPNGANRQRLFHFRIRLPN